jgi:telomere length regulation protein
MEGLLTPVSTSYKPSRGIEEDLLKEVQKSPEPSSKPNHPASTPEEALEILRNEPDFDSLRSTLRFLKKDGPTSSNFSLTTPSPLSSQLINALVSDIIPNYWSLLNKNDGAIRGGFQHNAERNLLLYSLRSVTGLSALLVRLKALIQQFKETSKKDERLRFVDQMKVYLEVTETTLSSDAIVQTLWKGLQSQPPPRQRVLWSEVVSLIGGGRLLNTSAESFSIVKEESKDVMESTWISDGLEYSRWLSRNIKSWALSLSLDADIAWRSLPDILSKSMQLGQSGMIIMCIYLFPC